MKNKKGFVMTETLVVTVFLVSIFTFIYVSIVPLIGKYEDLIDREQDIDIVYKLYHLRKLLFSDLNRETLTSESFKNFTEQGANHFCDNFDRNTYCEHMLNYLDLTDFTFVYVDDVFNNLTSIEGASSEMYDYIYPYRDKYDGYKLVIIVDNTKHLVAHLFYDDNI